MTDSQLARLFSRIPDIETKHLLLRRMRSYDAADYYEYARLCEVTEYLLWSPHVDISQTKRYLDYLQSCYRRGEFYDWAVTLKENRKMIGTCGFTDIVLPHCRGEVGYVLNPAYWGRGYMTEALMAVLSFGFFEIGLNRLEAHFIEGNERSRAVAQRCGMRFEGMLREHMFIKGEFRSIGICGIIRDDFPDGCYYQRRQSTERFPFFCR